MRKRDKEKEREIKRESESERVSEGERLNLPFAYFKWLQVQCSGSIYLNKKVGKRRERDEEICVHHWQYARKSKRVRKRE